MSAVLAAVSALAAVDAKQIGIRAIAALAQRNTNLGNSNLAGTANREQVLAGGILRATFQRLIIVDVAINPAPHENMAVRAGIHFNLLQGFVDPVDAISAVDRQSFFDPFLRSFKAVLLT